MNPLDVLHADLRHLVTIDFETYYADDYTLSKMTTSDYVRDPRFETIGCAVKVDDAPTIWTDAAGLVAWARKVPWSRTALLAHHAHFDGLILSHHYGIRPAFWLDTMSMGRALHGVEVSGSLAKLSLAYGIGEKGHEVLYARNKHLRDFDAEDYELYGAYSRNDVDLTRRLFDRMIDGFPEDELWNIDTTIRMFTEPTFVLDRQLLQEFLTYEQRRKAELLARVAQEKGSLTSNDKFAALLISMGVEPPRKVSPRTHQETWAFAKSDPGMQALLEHERDEIRWLAEARVGVKSTINESRTERLMRAGEGGRPVPVYLKYAGAHTFRWSGGDRMNFQNLERVPPDPDPARPFAGALRTSLCAPGPGRQLVVADSNAIEARMTSWLAGHERLVAGFRENRDVYSEFASTVYGRPIDRKKRHEDKVPGFVGKVAILGLGYSMGALKFAMTLASGPMGAKPILFGLPEAGAMGIDVAAFEERLTPEQRAQIENMPSRLPLPERMVHCAVAAEIVARYREENQPIVQLWATMEAALHAMVDAREMQIGPCHTVRHGIVLPNGLVMRYPGLKRSRGKHRVVDGLCTQCHRAVTLTNLGEECPRGRVGFTYLGGHAKRPVRIYGGSLTENIIQALARIVVANQLLYVRGAYGYHIVTMTHDEGVICVPDAEAPVALERMVAAMRAAPDWAPGLPLNAEGGHAITYGAAK